MEKEILLIGLLAFAIALSGCIEPEPTGPVCGNGICEDVETDLSCPEDCPSYTTACINESCTVVEGSGPEECQVDSDCQADSGNGTSFASAIVIQADNEEEGIAMEYDWIYYNGCEGKGGAVDVEMQEFQEQDGQLFDLLYTVCDNGETIVYYFNIDSFFGKWESE